MRSKARGSETLAAANRGFRGVVESMLSRGHWTARDEMPCSCSDPDKISHYCRQDGLILPRRLYSHGIVTAKEIRGYLEFGGRQLRQSLDSLLFGGGTRWAAEWNNLVVNEGLDHLLDVTLSNGTQVAAWYVGLLADGVTPLAAWDDTAVGSNDFTTYDEATLPAFGDNAVSSQSISNGTSADFTISSDSQIIYGAFLISTSAKTPAGTVYAAGAFNLGDKAANTGDTLQVTATFTQAAAP